MDFPDLRPEQGFHFICTIDGEQVSFNEVSGLDEETEVAEYRHGDDPYFGKMKLAGLMKPAGKLELKKGVFNGDDRLLQWFNMLYDKSYYQDASDRVDISIEMMNAAGEVVMHWNVMRAFPSKVTAPTLKSDTNEVAIESITFDYEEVRRELA